MLEDKFVLEELLPELVKLRQENQALKSSININRNLNIGNDINSGEHQDSMHILESIVAPFYSVDPEWRLTYVNSKSAQMWKRKPEELVGELIWNLFPHQEHTQRYQELHRAMRERIPTRFETFSPTCSSGRKLIYIPPQMEDYRSILPISVNANRLKNN